MLRSVGCYLSLTFASKSFKNVFSEFSDEGIVVHEVQCPGQGVVAFSQLLGVLNVPSLSVHARFLLLLWIRSLRKHRSTALTISQLASRLKMGSGKARSAIYELEKKGFVKSGAGAPSIGRPARSYVLDMSLLPTCESAVLLKDQFLELLDEQLDLSACEESAVFLLKLLLFQHADALGRVSGLPLTKMARFLGVSRPYVQHLLKKLRKEEGSWISFYFQGVVSREAKLYLCSYYQIRLKSERYIRSSLVACRQLELADKYLLRILASLGLPDAVQHGIRDRALWALLELACWRDEDEERLVNLERLMEALPSVKELLPWLFSRSRRTVWLAFAWRCSRGMRAFMMIPYGLMEYRLNPVRFDGGVLLVRASAPA